MTFTPIIRTQQDLEDAWRELMGPLGFSGSSVWIMLIDSEGHPFPHLTQIEDADRPPGPSELEGLAQVVRSLCDEFVPGGRVAFLRSRPGRPGLTDDDRAWAGALITAGGNGGFSVEVVHRASDHDLVPVPRDELLPDSAA